MSNTSTCERCGKEFEFRLLDSVIRLIGDFSSRAFTLCPGCHCLEMAEEEQDRFEYAEALTSLEKAIDSGSEEAAGLFIDLQHEIDDLVAAGIKILPAVEQLESDEEIRAVGVCLRCLNNLVKATENRQLKMDTEGTILRLRSRLS